MLTQDQTLSANRAAQTLPGSTASTVFAQITNASDKVVRRVAATANTTPETIELGHQTVGQGFNKRTRTMGKYSRVYNNTDISLTGGVTPSFTLHWVLDRPVQSGGAVTTAHIKDALGYLMDMLLQSGQLDKILNQEA